MVDKCLRGFNMTVLVYGQTNSGKTYTMHGSQIQDSGFAKKSMENTAFSSLMNQNVGEQKGLI